MFGLLFMRVTIGENKMPSPQLGPEYNVPVDATDLDPEVILWLHAGQGDPIYALGSRLNAYGETMASMDELDALASALDQVLTTEQGPHDEDDEINRMISLEYIVQQLIRENERTASVRQALRGRIPKTLRGDLGIGDFVMFTMPTGDYAIGRISKFEREQGVAGALLFPMFLQIDNEWETIPFAQRQDLYLTLPLTELEKIDYYHDWRPRLEESEQRYRRRPRETNDVVAASIHRTAGSNELEEFLADRAWNDVKEYIKEQDPRRFRSDVEQTLNEHPELVDALRQHGMTPRLFLDNVDEFYQYLQGGVWEDQHGYTDIDYARINQFVSTFESEWAATISGVLSNLDVDPARADEILNTLTNDPYVLHAFYCDEGWSCDWVDDILAVFGDLPVTEEDLGLSGNSDAGTMAYTDASWLGVQKLLARLLEEYLDRELEQAVPNYHDWRQTRMPV